MYNLLFATTLFILLKDHIESLSYILIDDEYIGQGQQIKAHLLPLLKRANHEIDGNSIQINHIGEHNAADEIARKTLRKKLKPDKVINAEILLREFKAKKRSGFTKR